MHSIIVSHNVLKSKSRLAVLLVFNLAVLLSFTARGSFGAEFPPAVPSPTGAPWVRTFSDNFTAPNATLNGWTIVRGTGSQYGLNGWGNNEAETYTDDPSNLNISGGGLNIVARVQNHGTKVTSARVTTQDRFSQAYGLFQFTAKMPVGLDLWPSFWLLPAKNVYGGWPASGEIDVMESGAAGSVANKQVQGSYHSGINYKADQSQTGYYNASNDPNFNTTDFNTYDLLWLPGSDAHTPGTLKWYVNGHLYETRSGGWYKPPGPKDETAPFDQPFYIIMNLAIGGPHTSYTGNQMPANGSYTMQITDVEVFALPKFIK